MNRKRTTLLLLVFQLAYGFICHANSRINAEPATITIPIGGNAWLNKNSKAQIKNEGVFNWSAPNDVISVYFRTDAPGEVELALRVSVPEGKSRISLTAQETTLTRDIGNLGAAVVKVGTIKINRSGYIKVDLRGISRTGDVFAEVSDLLITGTAVANGASYVKNNEGNSFYWGHRGPSVHLNYRISPAAADQVEWFYSEIMVPENEDKLGSYYMANGFDAGYFGMQVNSGTERRILFSVWSPFETDNPKNIPENMKIRLLKKGAGTRTGEFGNEGSGEQSYMIYPWKTGKSYAFLTRAQPDSTKNTTLYTSYFKDPEKGSWILIASFERPQSAVYLKGIYSFLENFAPDTGDQSRQAYYKNQWAVDAKGNWHEVTEAIFTADHTARANYRKDYAGGTDTAGFYLKNCGFFDNYTNIKTVLKGKVTDKQHPEIDFSKLP